jgi:PIN domain nuclease of toxin-antitoxin system
MQLVDTNLWFKHYWHLTLPKGAAELFSQGEMAISPISVLEIATKIRKGHFPGIPAISTWLSEALEGYVVSPLTPEIAAAAGADPWEHQDPADRLIVHTAKANGFTLVHTDTVIQRRSDLKQCYLKLEDFSGKPPAS